MIRQAIITLGGRGSRLKKITGDIAKPLCKIDNKSVLERTISVLSKQGIREFLFLCGYGLEQFKECKDMLEEGYDVSITIYNELEPAGEAGALKYVLGKISNTFIFVNGDIIFDINVGKAMSFFANIMQTY